MTRLMERKFRIVVLIFSTACLSMMLANILTLNFTIICMTEENFHWENFTIDLGMDVFLKIDFESKTSSSPKLQMSKGTDDRVPSVLSFPNVEIPGFRLPTPEFNWQSFRLAHQNPQFFLRLLKTIIVETSQNMAARRGKQFDPHNIDLNKFQNGFNLTDLNADVIFRVKNYILQKFQLAQNTYDIVDAKGRNISQWGNATLKDINLSSLSWNGVLKGQIRVIDRPADFYYTNSEQTALFSVVAIGALISIGFISFFISRFGCRKTFTAVGVISAISTGLCPAAASAGFVYFLIVRALQGIGFASCMAVIGAVTSTWGSLSENGLFNGVLTCFIQLGPVIAMPISGISCLTSLRWPATFYVHSAFTLLLITAWWLIYRDSPSKSKHVLNAELCKIKAGKVIDRSQKHVQIPLKLICTDLSVWAVWIAAIGNMYGIQTLVLYAPTYISKVLHYSILEVGFAAAIPTFLQFIVKIIAGVSSDRIMQFTETQKVRIFNSIAFCGMAFFYILLALCPVPVQDIKFNNLEPSSYWRVAALVYLIASATILGFNTGGFFKSATMVGREYAYFINTNVQIIMCVAILTVPFLVFGLAPNNDHAGWSCVFIFLAVLLLGCNIIFCFFGSAAAGKFIKASTANINSADFEQTKSMIKKSKNFISAKSNSKQIADA